MGIELTKHPSPSDIEQAASDFITDLSHYVSLHGAEVPDVLSKAFENYLGRSAAIPTERPSTDLGRLSITPFTKQRLVRHCRRRQFKRDHPSGQLFGTRFARAEACTNLCEFQVISLILAHNKDTENGPFDRCY